MKNIDKFYRVQKGRLVFPVVEKENLVIGETYNMRSLITDGVFGEERQLYFYEYSKPGDSVFIMTGNTGAKPFAVATNDCTRDEFPSNCLAKILITEGNKILFAFPRNDSNKNFSGVFNVVLFEVIELSPDVQYSISPEVSINIKVIDIFETSGSTNGNINIKEALKHTLLVSRRKTDDQTTPKYCFNPGRIVSNRLFNRDNNGDLVSYTNKGKKLVVNRNSLEGIDNEDNLFMRCFYSKKHVNAENIYVDGASLPMLSHDSVTEYAEKSNLTPDIASALIKKAVTVHGIPFYVAINVKGEVRPIYLNSYGYATFALNDKEKEFIDRLEDTVVSY